MVLVDFFWFMVNVNRLEELKVWQLSRELCQNIHILIIESELSNDFSLKRRLNMSCSHVMDNIAGGFGRSGNREFIYYLSVARGSLFEVKSQLYRVLDKRYINEDYFRKLYTETESLSKMIDGLMKYLADTNNSASTFLENENDLSYGKITDCHQ